MKIVKCYIFIPTAESKIRFSHGFAWRDTVQCMPVESACMKHLRSSRTILILHSRPLIDPTQDNTITPGPLRGRGAVETPDTTRKPSCSVLLQMSERERSHRLAPPHHAIAHEFSDEKQKRDNTLN